MPMNVYSIDDEEYKTTMFLCQIAGVRYPTVTPVTANELVNALNRIPNSSSPIVIEKKELLIKELSGYSSLYKKDTINLNIDIYGGLNGLIHGNIDAYEYFIPYKDLDPIIAGLMNISLHNTAALYIEFMEKDEIMDLSKPMNHWTNFTSLISIDNNQLGFFKHFTQSYQPFKVGLSIGNDWLNFQIARNRQSVGHGVSGNLLISDNFSYEEYMRVTFTSDIFNYYLDVTHFDQQIGPLTFADFSLSGMHQIRAIHRFEFTPSDSFLFSISLGSIFQSDSAFDWRVFVPMMIPHSFNNFSESDVINDGDEANNILSFDFSWSFEPSWLLHFEAVMDQIQLSYERNNFMPNAFGFLINIQNTSIINNDLLHSYVEVVYTMPYLYLNRAKFTETGDQDYNYDWILGHGITGGSEIQYSGYPTGPNTFKVEFGSKYMFNSGLNIGSKIEFMIHGKNGIAFSDNQTDTVNTGWRNEQNILEYTFATTLSVSHTFSPNLSIGIDTYFPYKWNYNNIQGNNDFIPQAFVFIKYSFL